MNFKLLHPADQIIMIMKRIYGYGMTTTSGGNLSIRDKNGDIWITPGAIDKGSLTRKDIIRVKPDGTIIGQHKPSSEFPFHKLVYEKRPDLKAVLHAHPPALVAFSIIRKIPNTRLIPSVENVCGDVGMAEYGLPGSESLGEKIADVFETGINTVILENHGIVIGGNDLFETFMSFETLDFSSRLEIKANQIGEPIELSSMEMELAKNKKSADMEEFEGKYFSSEERDSRREMCELIHRAYDQNLFTSTQGTFSQRLSKNSFIITPYGVDRKYIEVEDIVRIENGKKEAGKSPSHSVLMHKLIYEKHPHINSVIIAHAPNIMAFAVTDIDFDSRTIPESYVLLRDVKKLPFGSTFIEPEKLAKVFQEDTPIALVANDCVIVTGTNLINAFDRLEVAEYSAKAIIATKSIGKIVTIDESKIDDLKEAFKLQ
ncbi:L-fuculose-phosphate aldolase [Clostridium grantii DSM 8605]|uniref:L-fuculose-phosphate aldolase n=1 Tax=Clostridium grantii DSM 8605 TaxID=1121316 RepID=A0A1M5SW75_9CLOT|nr:L-fuculose-phosphate aldolase [Clostridium grantii DSM 8605]